jgi:hypothetical protein
MAIQKQPHSETVGARVPKTVAQKLEELAAQSRRSKSNIITILIDRAKVEDFIGRALQTENR